MNERTLVLLKPDAVARQITGQIITRFEQAGFKIIGMRLVHATRDLAIQHYREDDVAKRRGYEIWEQNLSSITKGPVMAICLEGINAVANIRKMVGTTEPSASPPGTIRGDFCHATYGIANSTKQAIANVVHASASVDEAKVEIPIWFSPSDLHSYKTVMEAYVNHTY